MFNLETVVTLCDFHVFKQRDFGFLTVILTCDSAPNTADIFRAVEIFDLRNITGKIIEWRMVSCNITMLTPQIFNFHVLEIVSILNLSNNSISTLPADLFHSPSLTNLNALIMDHNDISYIPDQLFATTLI